ncbi:MAG: hypothetical protein IPK97_10905 [Ahniella sp.]|nr:hypothetical protein [Ahniella sp.]
MKVWSLLSRWFHRRRYEQELTEELAFHLDCRRADLMKQGLDGASAERQARIELGMVELHKDAVRSAHGFASIDAWLGDLLRAAADWQRAPHT